MPAPKEPKSVLLKDTAGVERDWGRLVNTNLDGISFTGDFYDMSVFDIAYKVTVVKPFLINKAIRVFCPLRHYTGVFYVFEDRDVEEVVGFFKAKGDYIVDVVEL